MQDEFKTIKSPVTSETKVQGSRFIAVALPVTTKAEGEEFIAKTRKEFHDATHHCYAYRVDTDGSEFRFNDDGEPSGSAGKPILAAIDKYSLTNVLVIVTRYFGGTKLGVGGLARAYANAAELALLKAETETRYVTATINASFPHSQIGKVMHVVSQCGARIIDTQYDEDVHLTLEIRSSRAEDLKAGLVHHTNGNITTRPSRKAGS